MLPWLLFRRGTNFRHTAVWLWSIIIYNIVVAYVYLGDLDKAEKYYNKSYETNPDDQ